MITFNPGPSQIDPQTQQALADLAFSGFLSQSHRSQAFIDCTLQMLQGLRKGLQLPEEATILLAPSATAAMEIILRNLVQEHSFHWVHGAFSARFHATARELGLTAQRAEHPPDRAVAHANDLVPSATELLAVTHNETSTGQMWPLAELEALRRHHPDPLLAIDVTSSFACLRLPWRLADLWFASVQKGLGLPAGLALIILMPRAAETARRLALCLPAWQSLTEMAKRMAEGQTMETPNMLAIALLGERMTRFDIEAVERNTLFKARLIEERLARLAVVADAPWRSSTVAHLKPPRVNELLTACRERGMQLGSGYGAYKGHTIRLANFPAIRNEWMQEVVSWIDQWSK